MFNFKRLIKKYSKSPVFIVEEKEGYRDPDQGGIWIPGTTKEIEIKGVAAVVPLSNEDLKFDEGGTYSIEDRKLYCYKEIAKGTKIKHKNRVYTVLERKPYDDFDEGDLEDDGLYIYFIKRGDSN